jgi:phosphoribosylformylglycinamidine cyclo-ligase
VEKAKLIDGSKVNIGDILIGIQSSGVHSNGFSLVRKIVMKDHNFDLYQHFDELKGKLGEVLLTPTKIYVKPVLEVLQTIDVHAICHITGGGFDENIPRVLKDRQGTEIIENSWEKPPIFNFLEKWGHVPHREMFNIFNMGIGMILVVKPKDVVATVQILKNCGETTFEIGKIVEGKGVTIL